MGDLLGIPAQRWPIAIALVALLAVALSLLQSRFESSDVKKGIQIAMAWKPAGRATLFEALAARGEGDPGCDGKVLSELLGDVDVLCATPGRPQVQYEFRVLLDGKRPPRAANPAATELVTGITPKPVSSP